MAETTEVVKLMSAWENHRKTHLIQLTETKGCML